MLLKDFAQAVGGVDISPVRTTDFDEWKAIIESNKYLDTPVIRPSENAGSFQAQLQKVELGCLKILRFTTNLRHVAETRGTLDSSVLVTLPLLSGTASLSLGHKTYEMSPDVGLVFSDNEPRTKFMTSGGMDWMSVVIPRDRLDRTCAALTGRPVDCPLRFQALMEGRVSTWIRTLSAMVYASGWAAQYEILKENLEQLAITGLLLGQPSNYSEMLANPTEVILPRTVRRAIQLMEDNLDQPITISGIAAHLGVGMRALQLGFRRHLGCSPGEWLRDRRLDRARQMLSAGGVTVTHVALTWGFANIGEFAAHYRKRFGQCPSETLRRA